MKNKSDEYNRQNNAIGIVMFLFRMHSIGSIRPRLSVSDVMSKACDNVINDMEPKSESVVESNEIQEDVVVIHEEEMILVRKESPVHSPVPVSEEEVLPSLPQDEEVLPSLPQDEEVLPSLPQDEEVLPQDEEVLEPKCIEPEPTVSAPPSKSKPKKKQQKRK